VLELSNYICKETC